MKRKRIAYFMHVHWNWIKQRPHFLYEELQKYYCTDLFFIRKINENSVLRDYSFDCIPKGILKLPYSSRNKVIKYSEKLINQKVFKDSSEYDYIWITSPVLMHFIPKSYLENKMIIYDCMDDFLEFDVNKMNSKYNEMLERELIQISKYIFTSSVFLNNKIMNRYSEYLNTEPICINNGISDEFIGRVSTTSKLAKRNQFNIFYIGTISDWFDFDIILKMLDSFSEVIVTLVGPIETIIPDHPRLIEVGVVKHNLLPVFAENADAFIMPFKLNDLVRAVDPVKIYEYISFNKPIISVKYDEMNKFNPFTLLYSTEEELFDSLELLIKKKYQMYSSERANDFLLKNTWTFRAKEIKYHLEC